MSQSSKVRRPSEQASLGIGEDGGVVCSVGDVRGLRRKGQRGEQERSNGKDLFLWIDSRI